MKKINRFMLIISILLLLSLRAFGFGAYNGINSLSQSMNQTYDLINLYAPKIPALPESTIQTQTLALLQAGTNINDFNQITGFTPLHMAASNSAIGTSLIALLLNQGALVYALTLNDETPLSLAARNDRSADIINLLLTVGQAHNSDPMHIEKNGNTALNYLLYNAKRHQLDGNQPAYMNTSLSINYLLNSLNTMFRYGGTATNVQRSLISPGYYGPNTPSTTLSWLAYLGDINLLKLCISYFKAALIGENLINQQIDGKTAYDWAEGNVDMQQFLRSYGGQKGLYNNPARPVIPQNRDILAQFQPT